MKASWALLFLLSAVSATAAPVPGLFDTGVDNNRAVLGDGALDPHYKLVTSVDPAFPGPNAYACMPLPGGYWFANSTQSRWIAPAIDEGYPSGAPSHSGGAYTYRLTFDLTGFDTTSVQVSGAWAADNNGTMMLNGKAAGTATGGYSPLTAFTITTGFRSGINTLDFIVSNIPSSGSNPTGVRVQGLAGSATPLLIGVRDPGFTLALAAPVPNPAVSSTRIEYSLAQAGTVRLSIRNVAGREVRRLIDRAGAAGPADAVWDGLDDAGAPAPPGIYFVVLEAGGRAVSRRLAWLR